MWATSRELETEGLLSLKSGVRMPRGAIRLRPHSNPKSRGYGAMARECFLARQFLEFAAFSLREDRWRMFIEQSDRSRKVAPQLGECAIGNFPQHFCATHFRATAANAQRCR
jgi:hypothetical protein